MKFQKKSMDWTHFGLVMKGLNPNCYCLLYCRTLLLIHSKRSSCWYLCLDLLKIYLVILLLEEHIILQEMCYKFITTHGVKA